MTNAQVEEKLSFLGLNASQAEKVLNLISKLEGDARNLGWSDGYRAGTTDTKRKIREFEESADIEVDVKRKIRELEESINVW
jgi:hypothetical protein